MTWKVAASKLDVIRNVVDLQEQLRAIRNISTTEEASFFTPSYETAIHDPHRLFGMDIAVNRLEHAIAAGESILVWGDYDADGVTATAVLIDVLQQLGATVAPYLPHRSDEGYGLHQEALQRLLPGIDLLITVDCGVANAEEIAWLKKQGVDTIVVDHHEIPATLPDALSLLHPRHPLGTYPWPHLAGSGVAWKFAQALLRAKFGGVTEKEKWLLDLPVIGTIGDVMPLLGENRAIAHFGLQVIQRTRRLGLKALLELQGLDEVAATVEDIAFKIVPPINAAGRMDHPQVALDTLLATSPQIAQQKAKELMKLNERRRRLTKTVLHEAQDQVDDTLPAIFVFNEKWSPGIVGIVAGRLADTYKKPAIVIGGGVGHAVGSARTAGHIDIHAALQQGAQYALTVGGHRQAAGFSLTSEKVAQFREAVLEALADSAGEEKSEKELHADAIIAQDLVGWPTYEAVRAFQPFGEGNREPQFIVKHVPLIDARTVGRDNAHAKLRLACGSQDVDAIGFGLGDRIPNLGDCVDVFGSVDVNTFQGRARIQMKLTDVAPEGTTRITLS